MSDLTSPAPSRTPDADEPVAVVANAASSDGEYEVVRRRRRRRRRRQESANPLTQRVQVVLFSVIIVLLVVTAFVPASTRHAFMDNARRHLVPNMTVSLNGKFEVVALLVAALILLYLMPGVEEKVLKTLGLRQDKKSSSRR